MVNSGEQMVVSLHRGPPNIDLNVLQSLLKYTREGTPNFGKAPHVYKERTYSPYFLIPLNCQPTTLS